MSERPQSMLAKRVIEVLLGTIKTESDRAIKEENDSYLVELQNAKKLINKGCWTVRGANPYTDFMQQCMLGKSDGTLASTQEAMKKCAEGWSRLPEERKKGRKGEKAIYDYL